MKKYTILSLVLAGAIIGLGLVTAPSARALDTGMPVQDVSPSQGGVQLGIINQVHVYNTLFRYNGEVIVSARVTIANGTDAAVESVTLKPKNLSARRFDALQQVTSVCRANQDRTIVPYEFCVTPPVGFFETYYVSRETGYQLLKSELQDGAYKISLAQPLAPRKQTTLLISYRGFGYVKQGWFGRRTFDFVTLATENEISSSKVTVDVDTDLFFSGKKSTIQFRETQYAPQLSESNSQFGLSYGVASDAGMSNFVRTVDRGGAMTKTAQYLGPNETLTVKGAYATSRLGLYYPWLLVVIIGIIIIIVLGVLGVRRYRRRHPASTTSTQPAPNKNPLALTQALPIGLQALMGFAGAGAVLAACGLSYMLIIGSSQFAQDSDFLRAMITILFLLLGFVLVVGALLVLPLYLGTKYGRRTGVMVFLWEFLFLVIFLVLLIAIGSLTVRYRQPQPNYYYGID